LRGARPFGDIGHVRSRFAIVLALALAVAATASAAAPRASALRSFAFTGAGTNHVSIQTGELTELWTGRATAFGKITVHVAGWIQRPTQRTLAVRASQVFVAPGGDVLIGSCTGTVPAPDGAEDWTCHAAGGTGKFARSRGQWTLHIVIHRVSNANGTQKNRFTIAGAGRITWNTRR
jgi:hypothetical protein